jgi:hypothetical protein
MIKRVWKARFSKNKCYGLPVGTGQYIVRSLNDSLLRIGYDVGYYADTSHLKTIYDTFEDAKACVEKLTKEKKGRREVYAIIRLDAVSYPQQVIINKKECKKSRYAVFVKYNIRKYGIATIEKAFYVGTIEAYDIIDVRRWCTNSFDLLIHKLKDGKITESFNYPLGKIKELYHHVLDEQDVDDLLSRLKKNKSYDDIPVDWVVDKKKIKRIEKIKDEVMKQVIADGN